MNVFSAYSLSCWQGLAYEGTEPTAGYTPPENWTEPGVKDECIFCDVSIASCKLEYEINPILTLLIFLHKFIFPRDSLEEVPIELPPAVISDGQVMGCVYGCIDYNGYNDHWLGCDNIREDGKQMRLCVCKSGDQCNKVTCSEQGLDQLGDRREQSTPREIDIKGVHNDPVFNLYPDASTVARAASITVTCVLALNIHDPL